LEIFINHKGTKKKEMLKESEASIPTNKKTEVKPRGNDFCHTRTDFKKSQLGIKFAFSLKFPRFGE